MSMLIQKILLSLALFIYQGWALANPPSQLYSYDAVTKCVLYENTELGQPNYPYDNTRNFFNSIRGTVY